MINTQANEDDEYSSSGKGCSYCSYTVIDHELPKSPTTNIRMTSPGLLTPTTCRVAMMITAKNGAETTTIAAMTIVQKA